MFVAQYKEYSYYIIYIYVVWWSVCLPPVLLMTLYDERSTYIIKYTEYIYCTAVNKMRISSYLNRKFFLYIAVIIPGCYKHVSNYSANLCQMWQAQSHAFTHTQLHALLVADIIVYLLIDD